MRFYPSGQPYSRDVGSVSRSRGTAPQNDGTTSHRVRRVSESDLGSTRIREALKHRADGSKMVKQAPICSELSGIPETNPMSADHLEFVELLKERAKTYGIARDCMPCAASEIFVDRAARWFLTSEQRDVTWAEFKIGFLEFFLPT
ncbi:hypothetical protein ACLKA7_005217 [Drosophila subpalustris]